MSIIVITVNGPDIIEKNLSLSYNLLKNLNNAPIIYCTLDLLNNPMIELGNINIQNLFHNSKKLYNLINFYYLIQI